MTFTVFFSIKSLNIIAETGTGGIKIYRVDSLCFSVCLNISSKNIPCLSDICSDADLSSHHTHLRLPSSIPFPGNPSYLIFIICVFGLVLGFTNKYTNIHLLGFNLCFCHPLLRLRTDTNIFLFFYISTSSVFLLSFANNRNFEFCWVRIFFSYYYQTHFSAVGLDWGHLLYVL